MSATAFLRHRRAVAAQYVREAVGRSGKKLSDILARFGLTPTDLGNLDGNNDVLTIADDIAAAKLDEEELDTLEELNTLEAGPRAAVHAPDVSEDQFEDNLQHPCQETVGVGNMHDGPEAAEDLANVGSATLALPEVDGDFVRGAEIESEDALARGTRGRADEAPPIPAAAPSTKPAADQVTAEDEREPTDPDRTQEGIASTPVDRVAAAREVEKTGKAEDKLEKAGESAIDSMDRDQLVSYAAEADLDIGEVKDRDTPAALRKRIRAALDAAKPDPVEAAPAEGAE